MISIEVIARYVEALGGRLDLVADFGDRTLRMPVTESTTNAACQRELLVRQRSRQACNPTPPSRLACADPR